MPEISNQPEADEMPGALDHFEWVNKLSDEDLTAMLNCTVRVNEFRARMGLCPWEETIAGKARLARKSGAQQAE